MDMNQATLNLMLSNLEGSPEDSISNPNLLADHFEILDKPCDGNCRQQLQLVLQRANSIIKFKDSQCRDKDELIKLKDSQCSTLKDDLILSLKKSIEMQNTIDWLKTQLKGNTNQTATEPHDMIKELQLDHETKLKERDNQLFKLKDDLLSEASKIKELTENVKKLEKFVWFDPAKNSDIAHIKIPDKISFTAPLENSIEIAGPGWLLIQHCFVENNFLFHHDHELNDFINGFGDFNGDFWLGLEKVHQLTTNQHCELFIHLVGSDGQMKYARYDHFIIGSRDEEYKLKSLGAFSGNTGDAMRLNENGVFLEYHNFWYFSRDICNLNRMRFTIEETPIELKSVKMLIKPKY